MTSAELRVAAFVRILTGALFTAMGVWKVLGPFRSGFGKGVEGMIRDSWPFWGEFLRSTVIPHSSLFAWVVAAGELAVGIGLLLGLLTRWAAVGGALLMISILLGQTYAGPGASWPTWVSAGLTTKFALLLLVMIAAVDPGRVWGLDAFRRGRRPSRR
jgi:uncharacterized membrane protein YphA (DoxX/SURF4 family)